MTTFQERLRGRYGVLGAIVLGVVLLLLVRLWVVQVLSADEYEALAEENRLREVSIDAPRGRILDREGRELVTNRASQAVVVDPSAVEDDEMIARLAIVLDIPVAEIEEELTSVREERLKPRVVKADVPIEVVSYLYEHSAEFPGVAVETIAVRQYPQGNAMAHVLGYTGEISEDQLDDEELADYLFGDVVGKAGVELEHETVLQGEKGVQRHEVDARGRPTRVLDRREPVPGRDIVLTLDLELQRVAEQALADAIDEAHRQDFPNAKAGAAVLLDVETGEVLAMASAPTYDPTLFIGGIRTEDWEALNSEESEYPLNNRAVMSAYPPASTFKVVTGAAGLEEGVDTQWGVTYCPGRWTEMGDQWPKWCWKHSGHGNVSFVEGLEISCDTVFYEIGYEFYKREGERLQAHARSFGLGEATGVDLPGEVSGRVPDATWKKEFNQYYPEYQMWLPGDTVNLAIGQGDMLTSPLQMASVFTALANGGEVMRPHVLKDVLDAEGEVAHSIEASVTHQVLPGQEAIDTVEMGLLRATETGTAEDAFAGFGAEVAGKTGTAQVKGKDDYSWFAAYAPADEPRYAVAIVIEEGGNGGAVAAPAARQILAGALGLPIERVTAYDESR